MSIVVFGGWYVFLKEHWDAFLFSIRTIWRVAPAGWQGTLDLRGNAHQSRVCLFLALLGLQQTSWEQEPPFYQHFRISYKPSTVTADPSLHLTSDCSTSIFAFFFTLGLHRSWQRGWRQSWALLEMGRWDPVMQTNWEQLNTSKGFAWLLMAALLRNVVWGFFSLSRAISFTKCLTHMLAITHHGLGRDYFKGKLDSRTFWRIFSVWLTF